MQRETEFENASRSSVAAQDFILVRCRINGGVVKLELSIDGIRDGLGLPRLFDNKTSTHVHIHSDNFLKNALSFIISAVPI
ncbi:TPA: hypothetical protein N0F65_009107 [Lagenidium giganteum]|uniref:Uncharacterized protein n=1 Tax=Lagenidium giganteum TaxID=4803 RepID=A0AAV2YLS4_9STRA|nr:TPA: hypothetical protein N0F65_009107 [Lagenidium giganteum]